MESTFSCLLLIFLSFIKGASAYTYHYYYWGSGLGIFAVIAIIAICIRLCIRASANNPPPRQFVAVRQVTVRVEQAQPVHAPQGPTEPVQPPPYYPSAPAVGPPTYEDATMSVDTKRLV